MSNDDFNDNHGGNRNTGTGHRERKAGTHSKATEKTSGFPGVPGKTQSKSRSGGVHKAKVYTTSEGL